jgi:integrase
MATYKRGGQWWYEFILAGKRVRESAKTSRKTVAIEAERQRRLDLEKTLAGMPVEKRSNRINSVSDVVKAYQEHYGINHREQSVLFCEGRLAHVTRLLGHSLLPDLTERAVRQYIKTRLDEGMAGRTINMELGELSRALGQKWSVLWPKVRKLEERKDAGVALSPEEETRLLDAALEARSPILRTFIQLALLTGMRSGEVSSLTWGQVDIARAVDHGWASKDCLRHGTTDSDEPGIVRRPHGSCRVVYQAFRPSYPESVPVSIWEADSERSN